MINVSYDEFSDLAKDKGVIQIHSEIACDFMTPVGFFSTIHKEYSFILESVECSEQFGRFSIVGMDPKFTIKHLNNETQIQDYDGDLLTLNEDPFEILKELKNRYTPLNFSGLKGFYGGAVGYLAYDFIAKIEEIKLLNDDELKVADMYFIIPKTIVLFDHVKHTVKLVKNIFIDDINNLENLYNDALSSLDSIKQLFIKNANLPILSLEVADKENEFSSNMDKNEFEAIVDKAKQYIIDGEAIQIVVSQRFCMNFKGNSLDLYRALRMINPSPYMFMINFPDFSLVGSSPEVLVKEENRKVTIRPIAGTRKRGVTVAEDQQNQEELLNDTKEIAEHVMLVDLARNDIGRVCKGGSVNVDQLLTIEKYSHVMHIVSNVIGELETDKDAFDLIKAAFPAGTLSGAPKIKAMQIIDELETTKRGPYGGAVCYFDFGGNFDSCITIRTILFKDQKAYIQAGAGIVFDSIPENEYYETVNKAKAMFKALQVANTIVDTKRE